MALKRLKGLYVYIILDIIEFLQQIY
jgi:hypothetical protein